MCNKCDGACQLLTKCISCQISGHSPACCKKIFVGTPPSYIIVDDAEFSSLKQDLNYRVCYLFDHDGCIWDYALSRTITGEELDIEVFARPRTCDTPLWWPWVIITFFLIVVIGAIILIFVKIGYYMIGRREYSLFVKSTQDSVFGTSPIYVDPVQDVLNPGYNVTDQTLQ